MNALNAQRFQDLRALRTFICKTLCDSDQLVADQFPMTERTLVRGGIPCGMIFSLYGPRSVLLSAIWETDHNRVLFYNSGGDRFLQVQLAGAPRLVVQAAKKRDR